MRFLTGLVFTGLMAGSLQAQSTLNGPVLGFTSDNRGTAIRPILGLPGASVLADRLQLEADIRSASIAPKQDYALAVRAADAQLVVVDLRNGTAAIRAVPGTYPGVSVIAFSPAGAVAAIYDRGSKTVQVLGHLPDAPEVIYALDASHIRGRATSMAVSDDGSITLVRFVDAGSASLWGLDSSNAAWRVQADQPAAAAFLPNSSDAVVIGEAPQSALLIRDIGRTALQTALISEEDDLGYFSAVATSEDGRRIFLADAKSGHVAVVDLETRTHVVSSCGCDVTGLYRLRGTSVFRLSNASREPIMVLDASAAEPRLVVIPPIVMEAQ